MKVPPKRKGNLAVAVLHQAELGASMKVPPKRKGNAAAGRRTSSARPSCLNESPSEKEGKSGSFVPLIHTRSASMKVPPKRKGNCGISTYRRRHRTASMKVPPKRKGNFAAQLPACQAMSASMKVPPKRKGNLAQGPMPSLRSGPQ